MFNNGKPQITQIAQIKQGVLVDSAQKTCALIHPTHAVSLRSLRRGVLSMKWMG